MNNIKQRHITRSHKSFYVPIYTDLNVTNTILLKPNI